MFIYSIVAVGILMVFRLKKHLSLDLHFKFSKLQVVLSYVELKTTFKVFYMTKYTYSSAVSDLTITS